MKYAYQNNLKAYEFLGSLEDWQLFWVNQIKEYAFITVYPFNIDGIFKFSVDILKYFNNHVIKNFRN